MEHNNDLFKVKALKVGCSAEHNNDPFKVKAPKLQLTISQLGTQPLLQFYQQLPLLEELAGTMELEIKAKGVAKQMLLGEQCLLTLEEKAA